MLMNRHKSHLLIIDIQEKLAPAVLSHETLIATVSKLARVARRLGIPVTVSEQYPQGLGPTVAPLRGEFGNHAAIFDKLHFSCLQSPRLAERLAMLAAEGRNQIIVAGMEAHICVAQTVLDLQSNGYSAFVVADAVSARRQLSIDLSLQRLRQAGAPGVDSEMVLFEWLERAGTAEFKELQPLVK